MADPFDTPGYRYSVNRFPGDGATTLWNLSFAGEDGSYSGYISKTHVKAYTIASDGTETPLPLPGTAFVGPTTLKIEPAIEAGVTLVVYRDTPKNAPLLDYVDGALMIEKNLDTSNQQAIYAVAEMVDRFADSLEDIQEFSLNMLDALGQVQDVSNDAHEIAEDALDKATTAKNDAASAVITSGQALSGVTGAQEAAILAADAADLATGAAGLATTAANTANQSAQDALDVSGEARDTAQAAKNIAEGIDDKAQTALDNSIAAVNTANGIDGKAQDALDTANIADGKADTAVSTANAASLAAGAALQKSANLSDLTDVPAARTNLGLGTAAAKDVTTSATDPTPGRVLTVGAFGVGGNAVDLPGNDADLPADSGVYRVTSATLNVPSVANGGTILHTQYGVSAAKQMYFQHGTAVRIFARSLISTGWTDWVELHHSGNLEFADNATALSRVSATTLLSPATLGFAEQPVVTGSATFAKATNQIQMTDMVPTLALEVGDVIQISGSTSNDNLYTVESITDADNLIVNYEHRNGAGSLSLTDETGTATVKRIAKWFAAPLGLGQAWVNVFSKRTTNTAYINSTGRSIQIDYALSTNGATAQISSADGGGSWIKCAETGTGGFSVQMVIPSGGAYKFSSLSNNNIGLELR